MRLSKTSRELVYFLIRLSLIPFLIRKLKQPNTITILTFHNIHFDTAKVLFKTIKHKYNPITLNQYIECLHNKVLDSLPERSIIVTLDDGYKENYKLLSLVKDQHIKPTVFICPDVVDTNNKLWFNTVRDKSIRNRLKKVSDDKRLKLLSDMSHELATESKERTFLNHHEIIEMAEYFDFQSHTVTHPILPKCSDAKARTEILQSKLMLEKLFGFNVTSLAYPNGSYGQREIDYLIETGYKSALTLDFDYNNLCSNPYRLSRFCLNDNAGINEIIVKTSGLYDLIVKRFLRLKHY